MRRFTTTLLLWLGLMSTANATPPSEATVHLTGVVLHEYDTALGGVTVTASAGDLERSAVSDVNGYFDLGSWSAGAISLRLSGGDADLEQELDLAAGGAFVLAHIEGGVADRRGRLTTSVPEGMTADRARLVFAERDRVFETESSDSGRIDLDGLPAGRATFQLLSADEVVFEDEIALGWTADEWLDIDPDEGLVRDLGFLSAQVWNGEDREIEGAVVRVTDVLTAATLEAVTGEFGRAEYEHGVPHGMYRIEVRLGDELLIERRMLLHPYMYLEISTVHGIREGGSEQAGVEPSEDGFHTVSIFYGTDRLPTGDDEPGEFYGSGRGELELGRCEVSIPLDHELGELESPSFWRFEFREDPEKHVVLLSVSPQPRDEFVGELRQRVEASDGRRAFVFVHGYNVSFEDAARRTGQMAYDLQFEGAPILYSWPSKGSVGGYLADEASVEYTIPQLETFLRLVARESGAEVVHLIAHSMGNRAMTRALTDIAGDPQGPRFDQIALVAPDIDADVFRRNIAPRIVGTGKRITLYASATDEALAASERIHAAPRAGDTEPQAVVVDGIDTIDVSGLDSSFLGHSYFAENSSVIADLIYLLHQGTPPGERGGLEPASRPGDSAPTYWRFVSVP